MDIKEFFTKMENLQCDTSAASKVPLGCAPESCKESKKSKAQWCTACRVSALAKTIGSSSEPYTLLNIELPTREHVMRIQRAATRENLTVNEWMIRAIQVSIERFHEDPQFAKEVANELKKRSKRTRTE